MQNLPSATETIRAAHDLTIEHDAEVWRLYNGARHPDHPDAQVALVDANRTTIHCAPAFAKARQLPDDELRPGDIMRVVVGWAPESRNWHLGLLLAVQPEDEVQSQWCGLASWPAGPSQDHESDAKLAGQSLADVIDRPFHVIPARTTPPPIGEQLVTTPPAPDQPREPQPVAPPPARDADPAAASPALHPAFQTPAEQPVATPVPDVERVPVKAPPFNFERWTMQRIPSGYVWKRRTRWVWGTIGRAVGYALLGMLYLVLSLGTQSSGLAAVEPTWLPLMGLAVAVLLAGLTLRQLWLLWTVTDTIVDTAKGTIRARRRWTRRTVWQLDHTAVAYVLLTQTAARTQGRQRHGENTPIVQDVWMHLSDGDRFYSIANLREVEGQSQQWETARQRQNTPGRRRLRLAYYDTPAHHAARVMSDAIETELWQDIR